MTAHRSQYLHPLTPWSRAALSPEAVAPAPRDPLCDHCQERPATQKVQFTFDRRVANLCDLCEERGAEAAAR